MEYEAGFDILSPEEPECVQKAKQWASEKVGEGSEFLTFPDKNEGRVLVVKWRAWEWRGWATLGKMRREAPEHCAAQRSAGFNLESTGILPVIGLLSLFQISLLGIAALRMKQKILVLPTPVLSARKAVSIFLPAGILTGAGINPLLGLIDRFFPIQSFDIWEPLFQQSRNEPLSAVYLLLAVVILAPFAEELFFRVYWFGKNAEMAPFWRATVAPSLTFAVLHGFLSPLGTAIIFGFAVLQCWIYSRFKTPVSIISFHLGWNLSQALIYLPLSPGV